MVEPFDRVKKIAGLLNYSIINSDLQNILEFIPEDLSRLEIAFLLIYMYNKCLDEVIESIPRETLPFQV